jgi:hypothetical protein
MHIAGLPGAQIVVQVEQADGSFDCTAYGGVATQRCAYIVVAGNRAVTAKLGAAIDLALKARGGTVVSTTCNQQKSSGPLGCAALHDPASQKLLVLAGDGTKPVEEPSFASLWKNTGDFSVLPVLPDQSRTSFLALVPARYHAHNAAYWQGDVSEVVPRVFSSAAMTAEVPRVFISYRQKESLAFAMQLFDALGHAGFDVFLDRFRVPVAVNFQDRLTQELGDKSMIVVLESKDILGSEWTKHEINTAKACELTRVAIHLPNGTRVPEIDDAGRLMLAAGDFDRDPFDDEARLTEARLRAVVGWIEQQHDAGVFYRRDTLRKAIENALTLRGVPLPSIDGLGMMDVQSNGKAYKVWASIRTPELNDFYIAHLARAAPRQGVVVGLARLMELTSRKRLDWLSDVCNVAMVDKGDLGTAADAIAKGDPL